MAVEETCQTNKTCIFFIFFYQFHREQCKCAHAAGFVQRVTISFIWNNLRKLHSVKKVCFLWSANLWVICGQAATRLKWTNLQKHIKILHSTVRFWRYWTSQERGWLVKVWLRCVGKWVSGSRYADSASPTSSNFFLKRRRKKS